jgi:anti-anti-sigma regulatory factor
MDRSAEQKERKTLVLDGECTLDRAVELKSAMLEALGDGGHLALDLEQVTAVDLSFLQILCSAHQTTLNCGQRFILCPRPSTAFIEAAEGAGFFRSMGCRDTLNEECLFTEVIKNG